MAAISATNYATPSVQASSGQVQLSQARRAAEQAETNAKNLRAQADAAERQAQDRRQNFRKVTSQAQQVDPTYAKPGADSTDEVPQKVQKLVEELYDSKSESRAGRKNILSPYMSAATDVNAQGQSAGRLVDLSV